MADVQILIVEDDLIVAQSIKNHLLSLGYRVPAMVTDGETAISKTEELQPDLILMDIKLPGEMDGVAAAQQIKANFDLPVIYLTAYADEETLERAKITEPFGYILKPFGIKDLHSTLEMALYKYRTDKKTGHLNRVLRAIRNVNQLITHEKDRKKLLSKTCACLIETRGYHSAWIIGTDESGQITAAAQAGLFASSAEFLQKLEQGERPTCWQDVLQQPEIMSLETRLDHCDECMIRECNSEWGRLIARLEHNERVYGLMAVSLPPEWSTDAEERSLFAELAGDIAFALHTINEEEQLLAAEQALRRSEERYRQLLESVTDYIYTVQITEGVATDTFHGPGCQAVTGYPPEAFQRNPYLWYEMIHPNDREKVNNQLDRLIAGEKVPALEHRIIQKSNNVRWVRNTPVPKYNNEGRIIGYDGLIADITERKLAEEQAKQSRDHLHSIFKAAPVGIGMVIDRTFCMVNERLIHMLGYSREELIGQNARLIYPTGEAYQQVGHIKYDQIEKHGIGTVETQFKTKEGNIIDVLLSSSPIDPHNLSQGVTFTALDITGRKQAEAEREQLKDQLLQVQKMEAIGRLTGGIAHDFNNLLTAMNGFTELAQHRLLPDDPVQEMLKHVLDSGQRAADLVRQLLAFSRKQIIEPQTVDLNKLIANLNPMLQRMIGEDIYIHANIAPDLWPTKVDPLQIEQTIINLAVNARDAMPQGGRLSLTTANKTLNQDDLADHPDIEPGDYVLLSVHDTGVGIAPEMVTNIFEPFFTTKEKGKGTGLGLAMVYGIVKQNGGDIWVESKPEQGTTFQIYLPRTQEALQTSPETITLEKTPGGSETILLVEDDDRVRDLTRQILENQGYTVLDTNHASEALHLAAHYSHPIHLLLTDVVMPDINGKELAKKITPLRPDLKIIFISGYPDETIARHGVVEKGVIFLQKPFTPTRLTQIVRTTLDTIG